VAKYFLTPSAHAIPSYIVTLRHPHHLGVKQNVQMDATMSMYVRYLIILFFSLCGVLLSTSVKHPPEEAVNNTKYMHGVIQVAILPENLKPSKAHDHEGRRLIFIGDVHGTYNELDALLEKINYRPSKGIPFIRQMVLCIQDHVVFLGDLVSKGPHSLKVVQLAMNMNASCVIGNHDYKLLDAMGYIDPAGDSMLDTFVNTEGLPNDLVLGTEEHTIAMGFDIEAARWMLQCPLILRVGQVNGEELMAVHAGLFPGRSLEEQGSDIIY
jgi:hypothetical protein